MSVPYTEIRACRICGNTALDSVFHLGTQFLTGVFPKSDDEQRRAGEKMFVDYAGSTIPIHKASSGEIEFEAAIFVAVLGASSYTVSVRRTHLEGESE